MQLRSLCFLLLILAVAPGCGKRYEAGSPKSINLQVNRDSVDLKNDKLTALIQPYKAKLEAEVGKVVGSTAEVLKKEKPEGTLCNLAADAVLASARQSFPETVCSILNYGGLRIPSIGKGNITAGQVFELMPFENEVVVVKLKGTELQTFCNLIAENGGWPVSGLRFAIRQNRAEEILINTQPLEQEREYLVAISDYLAGGGDNAGFLKAVAWKKETGIKVRDAISGYIQTHSPLNLRIEGRISN